MLKSKPVQKYKELTEDELEMIHWRATRGCHFEGGFLFASKHGHEVIQNDVPLLIAEIRRLRATQHTLAADGDNMCRAVEHFYVDGVCAGCGRIRPAANAIRSAASLPAENPKEKV